MEVLEIGEASKFLTEKQSEEIDDGLCIRCLRKKFKCLIIYTLLLIVIFQMIMLLISKLSDSNVNFLFEKISQNAYTNSTKFINRENEI